MPPNDPSNNRSGSGSPGFSENQVPRHLPRTTLEPGSFAMAQQYSDMSDSNFSLSSWTHGSSQMSPSSWGSPAGFNFNGEDDAQLAAITMSADTNVHDASYLEGSMATSPGFFFSIPFPGPHGEPIYQTDLIGHGITPGPFFPMDYPHNLVPNPGTFVHELPSPTPIVLQSGYPSIGYVENAQVVNPFPGQIDPSLSESASECEYLGISKLQSYSGPRPGQPRLIRSATERNTATSHTGKENTDRAATKDMRGRRSRHTSRKDPRYLAEPDKDGWYHCPFEKEDTCSHAPTKQKCMHSKYLDSHLKPFVCKYADLEESCRNTQFSSNACLFRHEREMHGLHNHGINPFTCDFEGCDRARATMGFPRKWNQRDHMKRVHGWDPRQSDGIRRRNLPTRRRGSGHAAILMKRTGSSTPSSRPNANRRISSAQRANVSVPRQMASIEQELNAMNLSIPMSTVQMGQVYYDQSSSSSNGQFMEPGSYIELQPPY